VCRRESIAERRHDCGSDRSSGQTRPALGATALEHRATSARRHAGTEAVALGSPVVVGLKCALHESSSAALACSPEPVAVAYARRYAARARQERTYDLARLPVPRARATTGRRWCHASSCGTFWLGDGSCYGPAPTTRHLACPHLWTSVWTFARRAFQLFDQGKHRAPRRRRPDVGQLIGVWRTWLSEPSERGSTACCSPPSGESSSGTTDVHRRVALLEIGTRAGE
jgi:hypothetical protein